MDHAVRHRVERLEAIARSLAESGQGLALLALGSAGDADRMDAWSDLDFFAIVRPGAKQDFIRDLGWLTGIHPLGWAFQNTADGWKALYEDGIFLEFAVFEPQELSHIPFAPGRLVWHAADFDAAACTPRPQPPRPPAERDWLVGEALSNLYVGLGRWRRGERLSAFRFIQSYAVDRVLDLIAQIDIPDPSVAADPFSLDRRVERRHPRFAPDLEGFLLGADRCPDAARAILAFLDRHFGVNPAIKAAILDLAGSTD